MRSFIKKILPLIATALFLAAPMQGAQAHEGASGIVKERMDKFSQARGQMRALRGALQAGDLASVGTITADMLPWAKEMADAFPEGSDKAPSEALPAIWTDPDGFAAAIAAYDEALTALNKAALAGDANAASNGFRSLGASCSNCHRSYRK